MLPKNLLKKAESRALELIEEAMDEDSLVVPFKSVEREANDIGIHLSTMVDLIKKEGANVGPREVPKSVRGFTSKSDRWTACPSHGGTGETVISGFVGNASGRRLATVQTRVFRGTTEPMEVIMDSTKFLMGSYAACIGGDRRYTDTLKVFVDEENAVTVVVLESFVAGGMDSGWTTETATSLEIKTSLSARDIMKAIDSVWSDRRFNFITDGKRKDFEWCDGTKGLSLKKIEIAIEAMDG